MMHPILNVGVDVAKDAVVVACAELRFPVQRIPNQRAPLRAWLNSLPVGSRIGLESTGVYHEVLADLAQAHGHTVFLLNPLETRHYAKAMGKRAKTDRVDAELIARLIAQEHTHLRAYTPHGESAQAGSAHSTACHDCPSPRHAQADDAPSGWFCRRTQGRDGQIGCVARQD